MARSQHEDKLEREYVNEEGEVLTFRQIAYFLRYENPDIETIEDGFIINGERYE